MLAYKQQMTRFACVIVVIAGRHLNLAEKLQVNSDQKQPSVLHSKHAKRRGHPIHAAYYTRFAYLTDW